MKKILLVIGLVSLLAACGPQPQSSSQIERRKQEELSKQGVESVGFPAITNFAEKRMMKDIIELRDKMTPTYTYLVGTNNQLTKICDSIGYGLPYATQYTNPQMPQQPYGGSTYVLPQADPNGLFSPASADGTWVMCLNPQTKKVQPMYIEPRIVVSPFPLQ